MCRAGADRDGDGASHANVPTQGGSSLMGITVVEVTKKFGDFVALDDVSVVIPEGSLTALLGPSGSGKSTLLRVIAGLEEPDAGQVMIGGEDVTQQPARARGVGMVFQHYAAFKHMTVWDNVAFGLTIQKRPRAEIKERVHELLELYDAPANEFVMSFVGPVNRLGDAFVRPHDVGVSLEPDVGSSEAMVERVVHLGFEVRVELVREDGQHLWAQLTQEQAQQLELERGQIVYVRQSRETVFTP